MDSALCTFVLASGARARQFGLDVSLVGEVVTVEDVASVPRSPTAVRGIFNLRGTPVALLDFSAVMGLDEIVRDDTGSRIALVVRTEELLVGLEIGRMESVVARGRGRFSEPSTRDHPAVRGFLELDDDADKRVVTVLEPAVLLERLEAVRFVRAGEREASL